MTELQILVDGKYKPTTLDTSTSFEFNLRFGDLDNPTKTKNSFSTQIKLPKDKTNNIIFNHIYNLDHKVFKFNPIKRTPFRLYINSNLFEEGYLKLESIDSTYNIRLFGGLGDYFYTLDQIKLRDLDWRELEHYVDRFQVSASHRDAELDNTDGSPVGNHIKYALAYQGKYDNFDNKSITKSGDTLDKVEWELDGRIYESPDLNEHSRVGKLRDGRRYCGEYRSYYQRPAISMKYTIKKILKHMKAKGWDTELDLKFFNENNPYWSKLWIIKKPYKLEEAEKLQANIQVPKIDEKWNITEGAYDYRGKYNMSTKGGFEGDDLDMTINFPIVLNTDMLDTNNDLEVAAKIPFNVLATMPKYFEPFARWMNKEAARWTMNVKANVVHKDLDTGREARMRMYDIDETYKSLEMWFDTDDRNPFRIKDIRPGYNEDTGDRTQFYESYNRNSLEFGFSVSDTFNKAILNSDPSKNEFRIEFVVTGNSWWRYKKGGDHLPIGARIDLLNSAEISFSSKGSDGPNRTKKLVTAKHLFQDDKSCYDLLMSYSKLFGLIFHRNVSSKKISILTRNTLYEGLNVVDWSDKLDISNEEHTPVPFNYRYGIFKYNNKNTKYEKEYLSNTEREYGSLIFDNGLEFSEEKYDYIDNMLFDNGIRVRGTSQYYLGRTKDIYRDNKTLFHFEGDNGSKVDTDYVLAFFDGVVDLETGFLITDDTPRMFRDGYCWTEDPEYSIYITRYNNFTRNINFNGLYSLNFGRPSIIYNDEDLQTTSTNPYLGAETIYRRFWSAYINDKFDKNNRIFKAKFYLSPNDIRDIFRKFIRINGTLWVVDKINNFDPVSPKLTDVDLVKVNNPLNYVSQKLDVPNFTIKDWNGEIVYDYLAGIETWKDHCMIIAPTKDKPVTITIQSESGWYFENNESLKANPPRGGIGSYEVVLQYPENYVSGSNLYFADGSKFIEFTLEEHKG